MDMRSFYVLVKSVRKDTATATITAKKGTNAKVGSSKAKQALQETLQCVCFKCIQEGRV